MLRAPLDDTIFLFKNNIDIFDMKNINYFGCAGAIQDSVYSLRSGQLGFALINDNLMRDAITCNSVFKEILCCTKIKLSESINSNGCPPPSTAR